MQLFKIFISVSLVFSFPDILWGMENKETNTIKHYVNKKKDPDYLSKKMLEITKASYNNVSDPSKNSIFLNANILTYKDFGKELDNAHQKGVKVTVLLAQKSLQYGKQETKDVLKKLPTHIYTNKKGNNEEVSEDHAKLFLYDVNGEQGYSLGSANASYYGLFHNSEVTEFVKNDKENYEKILQDLKKITSKSLVYNESFDKDTQLDFSPIKLGKNSLKDTPLKERTVHSTLDKNFIELILNRLDDKKFTSGDEVWLSTYTFNSKEITDALCKLLDKGVKVHMYIDKNPLTTNVGSEQLEKLFKSGANIRAYLRDDKKPYIHHAKFLLIKRKEKNITILSTQNMLESKAFDVLSLDQNKRTFDDVKKITDEYNNDKNFKIITKEILAELGNKKNIKRKLDFDDTDINNSQNKKQKN